MQDNCEASKTVEVDAMRTKTVHNIIKGWQLFTSGDVAWQEKLHELSSESSYLHHPAWARYMEKMGWETCRWEYVVNGVVTSCVQGFCKRYFGRVGLIWFPDWIVGDFNVGHDFYKVVESQLGLRYVYVRFRCKREFHVEDQIFMMQSSWEKPRRKFGEGLTMDLKILDSHELQTIQASKSWRRFLKKASSLPVHITEQKCPDQIAEVYEDLKKTRSLRKSDIFNSRQIRSLMEEFGQDLVVLGARDSEGVLVAIRGCIFNGDIATDIFAATSKSARNSYVSYRLLFELLERCRSRNCTLYDLNGINPQSAAGVYQFKKSTGARAKASLGEYEWSNSPFLKLGVNILAKFR